MVEKAKYDVIEKKGDIEIRKYPEMILATVEGADDDNAFSLLFNYISGENTVSGKIKMTAPVISSKKIEMTAPVISNDNFFAFVLPSSYTKDTTPIPLNPMVKIQNQPKKNLAVLRFSGRTTNSKIDEMTKRLLDNLKDLKIKSKGTPFLMRYNSPFAPGFIRRNEIAVEILGKKNG